VFRKFQEFGKKEVIKLKNNNKNKDNNKNIKKLKKFITEKIKNY